ncbi:DMT family transporter [Pelagimonas varians]|uniref:Putative amino-acid metabolite efflux pump n=1 Tax=Pelagimonas varians TaxID=696760 RepID=A0A238KDH0_9RHOB|nr:DMT family transporter [Pelagimonas varians]PYG30017.1 drug/metabolite transporter (DMT)-like permease [Pelagimonas varians]SMX40464.1 putative amino-acid metabolite efflux pump [Pelagimonas varians]
MSETASTRDWLSIFVLGLVWGASFMLMSIGLEGYGPVTVATARTVLAAAVLLIAMPMTGCAMPKPAPGLWPMLIVIGLLSTAVPFLLLSWGMQHVPSVFGGLSMATIPLMVLVLAHFASDEKMIARRAAGVALGFGGALVLIGPDLANIGNSNAPLGQLACIAAAFCYALSSILVRRCPPIDALGMSALTLAVGAVALIPIMLWLEGVPNWAGMRPGLAILTLGLVQTAAMTLLRIQVIQSAGSVFMTLVNYQVPIWAMIYGAWLLNEDLPWQFFVALVMILGGLALGQWRSLIALLRR